MINPTSIYTNFKYVSAECGSGKTTSLCNMINRALNIKGSAENFIIVQNTHKLATDTANNFNNCKLLISDLVPRNKRLINEDLDSGESFFVWRHWKSLVISSPLVLASGRP
ncbi:DEAD/DEAH box helicase family protein [Pantoea sp. KPR_PJ]|uniref:DEAD/DEAH box helicase family protein n=1 Tax=Pantoea sp. KPR_PJ TaxID=2738375 RepID=UPI0035294F04